MTILRVLFAAGFAAALGASSSAASLDHIHLLLEQVRAHRRQVPSEFELRGAVPEMTAIKHELRDWIESRLPELKSADQLPAFVAALNAALTAADLTGFDAPAKPDDFFQDFTGSIEGVTIELQDTGVVIADPKKPDVTVPFGVLAVRSSLGVLCGDDESAYVYEWKGATFRRILADERPIVAGAPYEPQNIDAVQIAWRPEETGVRNILVLGHESWCASNWHSTYHRIWRSPRDGDTRLLVDERAFSYFHGGAPIQGSINNHEALVEYRVGSLDPGVHSYESIHHYTLDAAGARRTEPVALGPRAFVEEWLKAEWNEAGPWSNPALQAWHTKLHAPSMNGEFGDTLLCSPSDLYQVAIDFGVDDDKTAKDRHYVGPVYLMVRWRPPYRFQMVAVSDKSSPVCVTPDEEADEDPTLFPVQDWVGWK